ncbi:MAG: EamA/RhaT family transporter, partial [Hyphomicrobiales bacterium]
MKTNIATDRKANLLGSVWMVVAMAGFAVEDTLLKAATETLSLGQVLIIFGLGGALVFAGLLLAKREPLFVPDVVSKPMRIRVFFEITARLFYTL